MNNLIEALRITRTKINVYKSMSNCIDLATCGLEDLREHTVYSIKIAALYEVETDILLQLQREMEVE